MRSDKAAVRKVLDTAKRDRPHRADRARRQARLRRLRHSGAEGRRSRRRRRGRESSRAAMGFPVALKIVSPDILHKTEAGGVLVGLKSAAEAEKALRHDHRQRARNTDRKARIDGVQVQQMVTGGQEVIVGAVTDPSFGKLVAFGLGGVLVEVMKDVTFRLAPASRADALSMLDGIAGGRDAAGRARRRGGRSRGACRR